MTSLVVRIERRCRGRVCTLAAAVTLFSLGGVAASRAADPSPEEQKKTLSAVPADAQKYYGGYWYAGNVVADPFADWKPHPPPWQICWHTRCCISAIHGAPISSRN